MMGEEKIMEELTILLKLVDIKNDDELEEIEVIFKELTHHLLNA